MIVVGSDSRMPVDRKYKPMLRKIRQSGSVGRILFATLTLFVASQLLALPLHAVSMPGATHEMAADAECPMAEQHGGEANPDEPCECIGGACCQYIAKRVPMVAHALPPGGFYARLHEFGHRPRAWFIPRLFLSSVQTRAPPPLSLI